MRTTKVGSLTLRLVEKDKEFVGLIFTDKNAQKLMIHGKDPEAVWTKLNEEVAKSSPDYFGFEGARTRFLHFFPNGFRSTGYEGAEREYKGAAKSLLDATAPLKKAVTGTGYGNAVLKVFQATNLLSPFEKVRLQAVLRGDAADAFVQAAATFTNECSESSLRRLELILKPHDSAKWTVITYLAFLWKPEAHMFLKPEVTKDYAERVGHRFAQEYEPALKLTVYQTLLDMADVTAQELKALKPRDRIDIQSFIWVVGSYEMDRHPPQP